MLDHYKTPNSLRISRLRKEQTVRVSSASLLYFSFWFLILNTARNHYIIFFLSFLECSAGYYGENCSVSCGHCLNKTACDHITGICIQGCEPGYQAVNCTQGKTIIITGSANHVHFTRKLIFFFSFWFYKNYDRLTYVINMMF